ncbi:MAG: hypothetical protein AUJ92_00765 [Armatimonadetes bacterium CG2_30_59_28]|nr:MAG: hypothetical protein AUJ92_00765 [Armatimonadetes bacterium CG2_30_59_28]
MKGQELQQEPVWTKRELNRLNRLFLKDPAEMFDAIRFKLHEQYKDVPPEERLRVENERGRRLTKKLGLEFVGKED